MSSTALSDIQELIERTVFERIRTELVDKGYLPDIAIYDDTPVGVDQWESDLSDIVTSKGFAVELFSQGSNFSKGIKKIPRIVIKTGNFLEGDLGGDPRRFFEEGADGKYLAKVTPPQTADFYLDVHLVSNDIAQERFLNALLALAVPKRKYLPWYSNVNETFFIRHLNYYELDDLDQGITEKVHAYQIPDCWDRGDDTVFTGISKISRIDLNFNVQKYMDGDWGHDSDTLTVYDTLRVKINAGSTVTANLSSA